MSRRLTRALLVVSFAAYSIACGGDGTTPPIDQTPVPANLVIHAGNNQTAEPGAQVPTAPAVRVTTSAGAAVSNIAVTFAVTGGGGTITGGNATTNSEGVATLGSWTLGAAAGANTLTATISNSGVTGNPATFTATSQFPAFNPNANGTVSGTRNHSSLTIPAGVTITVTGPTVINVTGNASIAGSLTGDCNSIEVRVNGNLTIDGSVTNTCTTPSQTPPGIKLLADGELIVGTTPSAVDAIVSDGAIRITDSGTENLVLTPLAPFINDASVRGSNPMPALFATRMAGSAKVNRPVRAGRGQEVTYTRDGPIDIAGAVTAGNGTDATSKTLAGVCDNSTSIGGTGGKVQIVARNSTITFRANVRVKAGNGGKGGSCTSPSGCPSSAIAGKGGDGGVLLIGAQTIVFENGVQLERGNGGAGGDGIAVADAGAAACANGCSATATGGEGGLSGGIGYAVQEPGTITGTPSETGADGGTGGLADAKGGNGADCNVCPAGKGGDGGSATATGGRGGNGATGNVFPRAANSHRRGNGGPTVANGGNGGKGATCCLPQPQQGGNGGAGGAATSTGGQTGVLGAGGNGERGTPGGQGGSGGDGGDGNAPGSGGAKGTGTGDATDIPDGEGGAPGLPCPAITIELVPLQLVSTPGATLEIQANCTRTNFSDPFQIVIKDNNGTERGAATVPAGQNSVTIPFTAPSTPGVFTFSATATGVGIPTVIRTFQVTVNQPPPTQPDEVEVIPTPPGVQGAVATGTYNWNLADAVSQAVVGAMQVVAGGQPGGHFRADNPTRRGTGPNSWWADLLGTAIANGTAYVVDLYSTCFINAPLIGPTNKVKIEHLDKGGNVTKTVFIEKEGCVDLPVAESDAQIKTWGPEKNGFHDEKKRKFRRKKAAPPP